MSRNTPSSTAGKRKVAISQEITRAERDAELGFVRPTYERRILTVPTGDRRHIGIIREGRIPGDAFQKDKPAPTFGDDVKVVVTQNDVIAHPDPKPRTKRTVDADKAKSKKKKPQAGVKKRTDVKKGKP